MATRLTATARLGLFKLDGQVPHPIRDAIANVPGMVAPVGFMARTTRPAPLRLIHVQIVKVQIAIPEVRKIACLLCQHQSLRVTAKTKIIFPS